MSRASVRVKICGLTRPRDAREAAAAGADFLGVVLVSGSPRYVSAPRAREIGEAGGLPLVAVVADEEPAAAAELADAAGASVIQLHGAEAPETVAALRDLWRGRLWKAFRVREPRELDSMVRPYLGLVDGVLLDGWHPDLLGGAGVRFDWEGAAAVRSGLPSDLTVVAAGGLTPENVARVLPVLRPDVVDVSSGVESDPGIKDPRSVKAFIRAVRSNPGHRES
jgi:phosphoribosylanthranilate isomerase